MSIEIELISLNVVLSAAYMNISCTLFNYKRAELTTLNHQE